MVLFVLLPAAALQGQCDTEVSGIFTYCNSFNGNAAVTGYFVGFRVHDVTGASMHVVDLLGNATTNRGKRINDINTEAEPSNITIAPLQIGGGADSLEYWYFGPYTNGDSFHIALIDITGTCDTILVGAGVFDCADMHNGNTDPFACAPSGSGLPVPLYYLDFSSSSFIVGGGGGGNENVDNVFLVMKRSRERTCCDVGGNSMSCIELIVTLDENDLGLIIDDVGSGSTGGQIFADTLNDFQCTGNSNLTYPFQQEGGQSADVPLCLPPSLSRDYIILSCKPGANETGLSIDVIERIELAPAIVQANCDVQLEVLHVDDAFWFSPDDPNLDNLVTCTPDSTLCTFQYNSDVFGDVVNCTGDTFTYIVGRTPGVGTCISSDTILYDTALVIVYPELAVQIQTECDVTGDSVILSALITGSGIACGVGLIWNTGDTAVTITVPVSSASYSVTVTAPWLPEGLNACAITDVTTAIGILSVNCNIADSIASCFAGLPVPDESQVEWEGCNETAYVFTVDVSNGGAGCINDTLIWSRHYIIDADGSMNTAFDRDTCTQLFKFVDAVAPVIACPANVTLSCGTNTLPAATGFATATDNCDAGPAITYTNAQINVICPGSYTLRRTWRATDDCGNTSTCIQTITVVDNLPPLITCPPDLTISCSSSTLPAATGNATAIDNCNPNPAIARMDMIIPGGCPQSFTIQRRWIASDGCAQFDTCYQFITVDDTVYPTITCPADITIAYPASTAPSNTGNPVASDACSTPVMTYEDSLVAGSCSAFPQIMRTWTAVDGCGLAVNCTQWITITGGGSICGVVEDDLGEGIQNVTIQLWEDVNGNMQWDSMDILHSNTITAATGSYCFTSLHPCNYILVEIQPGDFGNLSDYDHTPDPDGVDTIGGFNNAIPVTLSQGENDTDNNFIELRCLLALPQLPSDTICEGESIVLEIGDQGVGEVEVNWNFGSGATPASGAGLGPHAVAYVSTADNQNPGTAITLSLAKEGCPLVTGVATTIVVNPFPEASISGVNTPLCYFTTRNFQATGANNPEATYQWNFGTAAIPATATGYGPHAVYYTSTGPKTVSLVIMPNAPGAQCPDSAAMNFNVISCPGQILGFVRTTENNPIVNVNLKLFADQDTNGIADNGTAIRNVFTNSTGSYSMASIQPGSYVIVQTQPVGWITDTDYDLSDDGDIVSNTDSLDNLIPCTILPGELDTMNVFMEMPQPATIAGNVFIDNDNDLVPDAGEGMDSVLIALYPDVNLDGRADTTLATATDLTDINGQFSIGNIFIGNYVLVKTTPDGYVSLRDYDATNDGDLVSNSNINNDTIPVTLTNGENDGQNYFINGAICSRVVTSLNDSGYGTLRYNLECADAGDTITFHSSIAGQTISITSDPLMISRDVNLLSDLYPPVQLASSVNGLFIIPANRSLVVKNLSLISGLASGSQGAAFDNAGMLMLEDISILKNVLVPPGSPLIWNRPGSQLFLTGTCNITENP